MTTQTLALESIPLEDITPHAGNVRRDLGDLTELADSILEQGLLEPIIVAPDPAAGWRIIAGHRRAAAAQIAGLTEIPAIVRADLVDEADQVIAMLVENLQRTDLTPIEEGDAYAQLQLFKIKPDEIARRTGRSKATVGRRLALTKLSQPVRDRIQAHEITLTDAEQLVEFANNKAATARLEEAIGTNNWRWILTDEQRKRDNAAAAKKARAKLVKDGVKIIEQPSYAKLNTRKTVQYLGARDNGYDTIASAPAEHAKTCKYHAAIEPTSSTIRYACTKASVHAGTGSSAGVSQADQDEIRAQHAAREQFDADRLTGAGVRRDWLRIYLVGGRTLSAKQRDLILRESLASTFTEFYTDVPRWLAWVDIEITAPAGANWQERQASEEAQARQVIEEHDPIVLWLAALAADAESTLDAAWIWTDTRQRREAIEPWLRFMATLGYELTAWETEQLNAIAAEQQE